MSKTRRRLAAIATGVLLLAGAAGAIAAGSDGKPHHSQRLAAAPRIPLRDLRAAADYLGLPVADLANQLRAGKTLDQVAAATPGKSAQGVVEALASEKRRRLDALTGTVVKRATSEASGHAKSIAGLRRLARAAEGTGAPARVPSVVAAYLGISPEKLQRELPGRTLAEVAASTPGRTVPGLIAALVSVRRERLDAATGAHRMSQARAELVNARLSRRAALIVNRRFPSG
jgi:hypothetical protein